MEAVKEFESIRSEEDDNQKSTVIDINLNNVAPVGKLSFQVQ